MEQLRLSTRLYVSDKTLKMSCCLILRLAWFKLVYVQPIKTLSNIVLFCKYLVIGWCSRIVQKHKGTKMQKCKGAKAQRHKCINVQRHKSANAQRHKAHCGVSQPWGTMLLYYKAWRCSTTGHGASWPCGMVLHSGVVWHLIMAWCFIVEWWFTIVWCLRNSAMTMEWSKPKINGK